MGLATMDPAPAKVAVEGPDGTFEYAAGATVSRALVVPPGGATLRFRSDAKGVTPDGDARTLAFRVERFRVAEAGGTGVASAGGAALK
jgi:hypothetical protein